MIVEQRALAAPDSPSITTNSPAYARKYRPVWASRPYDFDTEFSWIAVLVDFIEWFSSFDCARRHPAHEIHLKKTKSSRIGSVVMVPIAII